MRVVAAVAVVAAFLVACGDDDPEEASVSVVDVADEEESDSANDDTATSTTTGAVPPNGEVVDVVALDNTFRPETIEVVAGTAIRWENRGRNDHNVIPTDETASWGAPTEAFAPGDEYTHLFDTPGEYPYYCTIHATPEVGMIGTVVVLPADG